MSFDYIVRPKLISLFWTAVIFAVILVQFIRKANYYL